MKTILTRPGNKRGIAHTIIPYFPVHQVYIEPFFGAGGLFFEKPLAKVNIVNDLDGDVYNLFQVVQREPAKLRKLIGQQVFHESQLTDWKKHPETDPVRRALRFLFLSNYTFMGKGQTLRFGSAGIKQLILDRIKPTIELLQGVEFSNRDFRSFFKQIPQTVYKKAFIYCDPPYLDTDNSSYQTGGWTQADLVDLIAACQKTGARFAISEFDTPAVLKLARKQKLKVVQIGERKNLANTRMEILIKNY